MEKNTRWEVWGNVTGRIYLGEVYAETELEALQKAKKELNLGVEYSEDIEDAEVDSIEVEAQPNE